MDSKCSSQFVAERLLGVIVSIRENNRISLTSCEREKIYEACTAVKCNKSLNLQLEQLQKDLCKPIQSHFQLECLWMLHIFRILPLEYYLLEISNQTVQLSNFAESLTALCCADVCADENTKDVILSGLLSCIINGAFISECDISEEKDKLDKVCSYVLNAMLDGFFAHEKRTLRSKRTPSFLSLFSCGILEVSALKLFCQAALLKFLDFKPAVAVMDVFKMIRDETFKRNYSSLEPSIQFIGAMEAVDVINILRESIKNDSTNWESFLIVVAIFQNVHQEGTSLVNKLGKELVVEAFQNNNEKVLLVAFLIGRYSAHQEISSTSEIYRIWFQKNFSESVNSWGRTPQTFCLLMRVLSSLVPIETAENLKVPLENPPYIPGECRSIFQKFVSLSKSQIKDLKPVMHPETILEKVLLSFQHTGKIPPSILEASLLQKQHFNNEFLKVLLTPRILPAIPDNKMRFIDALKKAGKIPPAIYQQYEEACQKGFRRLYFLQYFMLGCFTKSS